MRTNSNRRMQEFFQEKLDELLNVPIDVESSEEIFADVSISDNDDDYIIELKQELDKQLEQLKVFNGWNISTEDDGIHILVVNDDTSIDEFIITIDDELTYDLEADIRHILSNISDEDTADESTEVELPSETEYEDNDEVYSSNISKVFVKPSYRKLENLLNDLNRKYSFLTLDTIYEEIQNKFRLSEEETFDVMIDYFHYDAEALGEELTCKCVSISNKDKQHYYKDNNGVVDGVPRDNLTLAMIKERWNEDCETDPDLSLYDSFADWFEEISIDLQDCGSTERARL